MKLLRAKTKTVFEISQYHSPRCVSGRVGGCILSGVDLLMPMCGCLCWRVVLMCWCLDVLMIALMCCVQDIVFVLCSGYCVDVLMIALTCWVGANVLICWCADDCANDRLTGAIWTASEVSGNFGRKCRLSTNDKSNWSREQKNLKVLSYQSNNPFELWEFGFLSPPLPQLPSWVPKVGWEISTSPTPILLDHTPAHTHTHIRGWVDKAMAIFWKNRQPPRVSHNFNCFFLRSTLSLF
jgi:hypothetical protein